MTDLDPTLGADPSAADAVPITAAPDPSAAGAVPLTTAPGSTTGTVPPTTAPAPTNPIMGAYLESYAGKGDWTATSGGKPNYAWNAKIPPTSYHPSQQRPLQQNFKLKAHHYRVKALDPLFKQGNNVAHFRDDVMQAFCQRGLDTITYLPDLAEHADPAAQTATMHSVIDNYSRFTANLAEAIRVAKVFKSTKFDDFDRENDAAAIELLHNSLDADLRRKLAHRTEDSEPFTVHWLRLMHLLVSPSSKHFDELRQKIRSVSPRAFAEENIDSMCESLKEPIDELLVANQYSPILSFSMLQSIVNNCSQQGSFSFNLFSKINEVEKEMKACSFKSHDEANRHMEGQDLDPHSILKFLVVQYEMLEVDNLWTPARRPKDSTKAPANFLCSSGVPSPSIMQAMADNLVALMHTSGGDPSSSRKTPQNSPCHICNKKGHWSRDCKEKKNGGNGGGRGGHRKPPPTDKSDWKKTAPAAGAPSTKKVKQREFHWCEKCQRWSTTHSTATHVRKPGYSADQAIAANLASIPEGLWLATDSPSESPTMTPFSFLTSIMPAVIVLLFLVSTNKFTLWNDGTRTLVAYLSLLQSTLELIKSMTLPILFQWKSLATITFAEAFTVSRDFLTFVISEVKTVPIVGFIAPALWFALFIATVLGPRIVILGAAPSPPPRSWFRKWKQHLARQSTRCRRKASRWLLEGIDTPRLKGRHYLRPRHLPATACPTNDARLKMRAQGMDLDTANLNVHLQHNDPRKFFRHFHRSSNFQGRHRRHPVHSGYKVESNVSRGVWSQGQGLTKSQRRGLFGLVRRAVYEMPVPVTSHGAMPIPIHDPSTPSKVPTRSPSSGRRSKARKPPVWQTTPPPFNGSHEKWYRNNLFYWCAKCKKWSTTHDTLTHVKPALRTVRMPMNKPSIAPNVRPTRTPSTSPKSNCKHCSSSDPQKCCYIHTPQTCNSVPHRQPFGAQDAPRFPATHLKKQGKHLADKIRAAVSTTIDPPSAAAPKEQLFPIIFDSGASYCITHDKSDFISFSKISSVKSLAGFVQGSNSTVQGEGELIWHIRDDNGNLRALRLHALYIPNAQVRLLSTATFTKQSPDETFLITKFGGQISGVKGDPSRGPIFAPMNEKSQLLVSMGHRIPSSCNMAHLQVDPSDFTSDFGCLRELSNTPGLYPAIVPTVSDINTNLSQAEKELLKWHQRLGHIAFAKIQYLFRTGALASSDSARRLHRSASSIQIPKCAACLYAKQRARTAPGSKTVAVTDRGVLRKDNLLPGQEISVDHFICSQKGRLFTSRGKESDKEQFVGGCIFADHASGYVHIEFQRVLTSHATLAALGKFEAHCRDYGVIPLKYMSDNGSAFTSKDFTEHLSAFQQTSRFAGVGQHHANGHVERQIQTIMSISRAMMIHSALHWPEVADSQLWPMCVAHACFLWNHVPNPSSGISPADLFTKVRFPLSKLHEIHVWGSPAYVLNKRIADGQKIPRWEPRSNRAMYLGRAPQYASTVHLLLNLQSGSITPQFHVVLDDWFATVAVDLDQMPDFNSDAWKKMFGKSEYQYEFEETDLDTVQELSAAMEDAVGTNTAEIARDRVLDAMDRIKPIVPIEPMPNHRSRPTSATVPRGENPDVTPQPPVTPTASPSASLPVPRSRSPPAIPSPLKPAKPTPAPPPSPAPSPAPTPTVAPSSLRRSSRNNAGQGVAQLSPTWSGRSYDSTVPAPSIKLAPPSHFHELFASINCVYVDANDGYKPSYASILAAKSTKDPDLLSFEEAMSGEDRELWIAAAKMEIDELEGHGVWIEVSRAQAAGNRIVPATWVFRIKRSPSGEIKRRKARICLRGDLMEGITDTFAPVVSFSSVRTFLIFSLLLGWDTCSIDFSNAFVQAKRTDKVYMHVPRGFRPSKPDSVLLLIKSLYGAKDAPKLWSDLLFKTLAELGFKQSRFEACMWYRKDILIVLYVDDCGIAFQSQKVLDDFIAALRAKNFKLTVEESFNEFLGIQYTSLPDGSVECTQEGLISKIIDATGLKDANPNKVPAASDTLGTDPDGAPFNAAWSYPSVVGMLLYLTTNTRPDIAFAVSQVARFTHNPKESHATAVKMIVRYLKGTRNKGTIVRKASSLKLTVFCDADFAGLYRRDPDDSVSSAKSRAGYLIKLSGCPLIWKSQLCSTIALSTAESEYYSLSLAMRALLPIRNLLLEMIANLNVPDSFRDHSSSFAVTVFEDNQAALNLATTQRLTSRTRHYHVRWHFFWQAVRDGKLDVVYIATREQEADYLTKGLPAPVFVYLRMKVQGW